METGILENNGHVSFFQGAEQGASSSIPLLSQIHKAEILDSEHKLRVNRIRIFFSHGNLGDTCSLCGKQIKLNVYWLGGKL